ncbi:LWR-salt protein [Natrinema longum]|uniref:LWR-salt protein n=1 Tax=Natrinema longum TaxID=370324 RepID=A0A8A2UDD0_9EURY|nr:LWR-salt protein [Natrinema longum]MBZ6495445.1 LWR-salt protein [Natrinema longum]QSW86584.1 LWR-salt protein [Natrinema longum]
MDARYVFRVRLRLEPAREEVSLEPGSAETTVTLFREAPEPGTEGWLFFGNTLWRGEVADQPHARRLAAEWLGVPARRIEDVDFRELQADEEYVDALKREIAADLEPFNADTVSAVLSKYLGSSVHVRSP